MTSTPSLRFAGEHQPRPGFQGRDILRFLAVDIILILAARLLLGLGVFPSLSFYVAAVLGTKVLLLGYLLWLVRSRPEGWRAAGAAGPGAAGRWWSWPLALALYAAAYPALLWLTLANDRLMQGLYSLAGWRYVPEMQDAVALIFDDSGALTGWLRAVLVGFAVLIGPWMEELAFRGVGMDGFRRSGGAFGAVVWMGALFGVYHFSLALLLPLAALGILFGIMRSVSGSLWCPVIYHCLHNALALTVTAFRLGWLENYRSFFNFL